MTAPASTAAVEKQFCDERHGNQQRQIEALFEAVDKINVALATRLPLWATMLIGCLMAAVGWLLKAVI